MKSPRCGGDHLEATVSEKNVEPLNECMIRVVCEYCGIDYEKVNETSGETKIYRITYAQDLSNCLTDAPESAKAGETVEIRAEAGSDFRLFLNGGTEIERFVGQDRVPVFTFTMPEYSVIITDEECDF